MSSNSDELGVEILKALGVPIKNCISASIDISPTHPLLVHASYYCEDGNGDIIRDQDGCFQTKLKRFELVEKQQ